MADEPKGQGDRGSADLIKVLRRGYADLVTVLRRGYADLVTVLRRGYADLVAVLRRGYADLGPVASWVVVHSMLMPLAGALVIFTLAGRLVGPIEAAGLALGLGLYTLSIALLTGTALMPTWAMAAVAGFLFGPVWGSIGAVIGITGGGAVGMAIAGLLTRERVLGLIRRYPKAERIRSALVDRPWRDEFLAIGLIRLSPSSPFALTNVVLAASGTRFWVTLGATMVGVAPRTVVAAVLGAGVSAAGQAIDNLDDRPPWLVAVGIGVAVFVVIVLYALFSRWLRVAAKSAEAAMGMEPVLSETVGGRESGEDPENLPSGEQGRSPKG